MKTSKNLNSKIFIVSGTSGTGSCSSEMQEHFRGTEVECQKYISAEEAEVERYNQECFEHSGHNYVPRWYRASVIHAEKHDAEEIRLSEERYIREIRYQRNQELWTNSVHNRLNRRILFKEWFKKEPKRFFGKTTEEKDSE